MNDRWLLPEGIEELLPAQAERAERLRRRLLDLFHAWGYDLVMPPFIEYLESLLVGTGHDLDLETFKLIDQLTGRLMGVRADMTPQVARIDAHQLRREQPTRLCYIGTVLHTRPNGFHGARSLLQVGCELYGHDAPHSDVEVLSLMAEMLALAGVRDVHVDLGHVGVFRGLSREAGLTAGQEAQLFDALQRKARPEIGEILGELAIPAPLRDMLLALADLHGGEDVLRQARGVLAPAGAEVRAAIDNLEQIAFLAMQRLPRVTFHFDLAELRGFNYHTGAVFAAYVPGHGQAIVQGGRYDEIGRAFGRARPATGFSSDLKTLILLGTEPPVAVQAVFAPAVQDQALEEKIRTLRASGVRVIGALPGQQGGARAMGCERVLIPRDGAWTIIDAEN